MLDFVFAFLIFTEIILTYIVVKKIIELEKKVDEIHVLMLERAKNLLELIDVIKSTLKKVNKVISFITNKRFKQIRRIISLTISIIQMILLIRSFDFSKGLKSINYKNVRKIIFSQAIKELIKKTLGSLEKFASA